MSRRFQLSFLSVFFTVLIAAFAVAVAFRVKSYRSGSASSDRGVALATTESVPQTVGRNAGQEDGSLTDASAGATGTIVDASSTVGTPESRRLREQRYRELLQAPITSRGGAPPGSPAATRNGTPPPAAAAPNKPAPQPPSLLSRIVAPIAKVFSGGDHPAPPASDNTPKNSKPIDDPNSDVTPPQLLSAMFDPPTVHDGEETMLLAVANDDISGVRSIAGNVISPSGALQGFALTRQADAMHYAGRIVVPKSAAEGLWRVNYLNLTDNANNSTTLSASQGTLPGSASFRVVSSNADSNPPTLRAVWLDRPTIKGAEKNALFVQADDDKSGVNLVSGVFLSPAKLARIGFGCSQPDSGNTFRCEFTPPAGADCGDWQLEQVQLQDKANNMIAVRRENPLVGAVHVTVLSDQCDSHPPVVDAITLDRYVTTAPGTVVIRVGVTDDLSGVGSVSGHFTYTGAVAPGNQPPKLWFACAMTDPQTWSGPVAIPDKAAIGTWRLEQLQVLDKSNNLKIYSAADPLVANVTLKVQ